jgi:aspartyl protease family protein
MGIIKLLSCIALIAFGLIGKAQQLTLDETINYINQSIDNDDGLSLSSDGMLKYSGISYLGKPFTYTVHISEIHPSSFVQQSLYSIDGSNPWYVSLTCKGTTQMYNSSIMVGCIQSISDGKQSNIPTFNLYTKGEDKYSTEKLLNAVNYLFALARENNLDKRNDNDPFAPNNFNSNSVEIKSSSALSSIKLSMQNGVYHISVTIGGVTRYFVFDTGASDVLISQDLESALLKNGTINKTNYLAPALYRIADGSIVQCKRLVIPKIIIGNYTITNVKASIGVGSVPLLLGKSVLDKFKNWSINNQTQTLNLTK